MEGTPIPLALPVKRTPTTTREGIAYEVRALLVANWASGEREKRPSKVPNASHETGGLCLRRCCPLMWHLPRFVWLIRHALSRDPSLSFAFQSL